MVIPSHSKCIGLGAEDSCKHSGLWNLSIGSLLDVRLLDGILHVLFSFNNMFLSAAKALSPPPIKLPPTHTHIQIHIRLSIQHMKQGVRG